MGNINGLMWFKRRMNDSEILNHIKEIVNEGFYYISPCDYINQYDDFLGEILYSVTITFINSYEELYNSNSVYDQDFENFVYDFIERKFKTYIEKNFLERVVECQKDDDIISEQTSDIPMYFKRRHKPDIFKKYLDAAMMYWINQRGQNERDFLKNVMHEAIYGFFKTYHKENPFDIKVVDVYLFEDFIYEEYGEYILEYYNDNYW